MSNRRKSSSRQGGPRQGGPDDKSGQPFEIKHRIAGAVVLMLVAVVVIPLLLSDPAVEANNSSEELSGRVDRDFKSRIVPLNIDDAGNVSPLQDDQTEQQGEDQASTVVNVGNTTVVDDSRPALLDLTKPGAADNSIVTRPADADKDQSDAVQSDPDAADVSPPQTVVMTQKVDSSTESKTEQSASLSADQTTGDTANPEDQSTQVASIDDDEVVKQGWVVRVGTFSKAENVKSVSSLLTNSGFRPKNTSVSTSLGPSTRVWLGPYAKRETADKISDRLKSLTGEKGYVTKTSS